LIGWTYGIDIWLYKRHAEKPVAGCFLKAAMWKTKEEMRRKYESGFYVNRLHHLHPTVYGLVLDSAYSIAALTVYTYTFLYSVASC
jgi:hypothetical protein